MSKELKCPLCKNPMTEEPECLWVCETADCALVGDFVSGCAVDALNTRLAEAERLKGVAEKKMAYLRGKGFRVSGYLMTDDNTRCTVDRWGRVEWLDSQSQAEAERLRSRLRELISGLRRAGDRAQNHYEYHALRGAANEIERELTRIQAADEPTCQWTLHVNDCSYASACGRDWQFNDGGPAENNVRFCHGCGKRVAVADETGGAEG